jgi:hypothetical protein
MDTSFKRHGGAEDCRVEKLVTVEAQGINVRRN